MKKEEKKMYPFNYLVSVKFSMLQLLYKIAN